jgi:8-oxo-dGTP diphosphatase
VLATGCTVIVRRPGGRTDTGGVADDDAWRERFPDLFAPGYWEWGGLDVQFTVEPPPQELVSNVHLVARSGGKIVVSVSELGWRLLPGGTREPGETVAENAARELLEEAGATLLGPLQPIGAHRGRSRRSGPWRPHLPYPVGYWLWAAADVAVTGPPSNPPDGEQIVEVLLLGPLDAIEFLQEDHPTGADVVRLAMAMDLV